jgi:hypothetical protein
MKHQIFAIKPELLMQLYYTGSNNWRKMAGAFKLFCDRVLRLSSYD